MNRTVLPTPAVPTRPGAFLRWFLTVPVRKQTWANQLYLWLAFPLGVTYFGVLLSGFITGGVLVMILVGVLLLVGMVYLVRELTAFERWLADTLLSVPAPPADDRLPTEPRENLKRAFVNLQTWTGLAFLVSKFAIGLAVFIALVFMIAFSLAFMLVPFNYRNVRVGLQPPGGEVSLEPSVVFELQTWQVGLSVPFQVTTWYVNSLPEALAVAGIGVVLAFLSLHLCNAMAWLLGWYARVMLGDADRSAIRQLVGA